VTDRPIIFSAAMVKALLAGRKTMTRRLATSPLRKCKVGDRLWVRESCSDEHPLAVQEGRYSQEGQAGIPGPPPVTYRTIYRADGEPLQVWRNGGGHPYFTLSGPRDEIESKHPCVTSNYHRAGKGIYWTPSIHMPRWASRLTLVVSTIKVERLNSISHDDALAEGCKVVRDNCYVFDGTSYDQSKLCHGSPVTAFSVLWDDLHGADSWNANPEVVAISFSVVKSNIDGTETEVLGDAA